MVLRISNCPYCGAQAVLTERSGGWTVDCPYADPLTAILENKQWCSKSYDDDLLYDSPDAAIIFWNKRNEKIGELENVSS